MWVLSTASTRRWLRPGKKYIVGRASRSNEPADIVLKEPSVSRHHLSIEVKRSDPGAAHHLNVRPVVVLTDLESRFGSTLDDGPLKQANLPQRDDPVNIKVGTATVLTITWDPLVVSTIGPSPGLDKRIFEIAKVLDHVDPRTSLLLCLQTPPLSSNAILSVAYCLATQKPIVISDYINAVCEAANTLESDMNAFPDPLQYLVKPQWAPDAKRSRCFEGQLFWTNYVDLFETLSATIQAAGGTLYGPSEPYRSVMVAVVDRQDPLYEQATDLNEILVAIEQSRPAAPKSGSRKRPRQVRMLDFMTQDSQVPDSQPSVTPLQENRGGQQSETPVSQVTGTQELPSQYGSQSRRKRVAKLPATFLDVPIKEEPESFSGPLSNPPMPEVSAPASVPASVPEARASETIPQPEEPSQISQAPSQKRKRVAPIANSLFGDGFASAPQVARRPASKEASSTEPSPPAETQKKKKTGSAFDIVPEFAVQNDESSPEDGESLPSTPDVQNLVLVEECIPIMPARTQSLEPAREEWSGMPNFKAFRRKNVPQPTSLSLVEDDGTVLDQQLQKDEQLFVDEPDRDDDIDPDLEGFDSIRHTVPATEMASDDEFSFHFS